MADWHLRRIPRHAHFYWGHDYMPWVRYLTLETFRRHNPDWAMTLWQPKVQVHVTGPLVKRDVYGHDATAGLTPDYLWRVPALGVDVRPVDVEELAGVDLSCILSEHVREQVKADYHRLWAMTEIGGLSSDMDILFYRPMEAGAFNAPENAEAVAGVTVPVAASGALGIFYWGFMLGATGGEHFGRMWRAALAVDTAEFREGHNFYRVAGHLARELWGAGLPPGMFNMPFYTVYADTDRFDLDGPFPEAPERIGIHWHGSSSYGTFVGYSPETFQPGQNLMSKAMVRALEGLR